MSVFLDGQDEERRALFTVSYRAERTGRSLTVEPVFTPEGEAPPDSLPRVMEGVVRRSGETEEPREVRIEGAPDPFTALMAEFDPGWLEAEQA